MSSKLFDWSDNYDYKKQSKCTKCGLVYNKTPEYDYDNWNVGHYGCTSPTEYIKGYKDNGCPYCKKKKEKEEANLLQEANNQLIPCKKCGTAKIEKKYWTNNYHISCDCVILRVYTDNLSKINSLVDKWNKFIS